MTKNGLWLLLAVISVLCYSCSVERFIPEDEFLYTKETVELTPDSVVNDIDNIKLDLQNALRPEPVSSFLGGYPGLYFHYKANREKPGFINRFLNKKFGQEPVYDTDIQTYEMEQILLNRLENKGFFYSVATSEIVRDTTNKEAEAIYRLRLSKPYRLKTYQLDTDSLGVYKQIQNSLSESLLKKDMRFDLSAMKAERQRIDGYLKERGYYNFNSAFLIFETDTNQYRNNRRFDLYLRLKKDVPAKSVIPYKLAKVNVYPYNTVELDSSALDTVRFAEKNFIQGETFFKPKRLDPFILLEEGDLYDPSASKATGRRLGSIGAYKYVNIRYNELDTEAEGDSLGLLEANIFLSPLNKRAVRAEVKGVTKSNGFSGPGLGLTFVNRNLFKGGETLNISLDGSYEVQAGGSGANAGSSSIQLGVNGTLIFPRMLFPIEISKNYFKYDIPKTKIEMGVAYLNRTKLFTLGSVEAKFGYVWQANKYITHEINPVAINYVSLANTTPEFDEILEANPFLRTSFEQQFISGLTYSFIYNGMVDTGKKHQIYFNANFDTAGNSLSLIAGGERPQSIFGLEYAQYARLDADVRYHFNFSNQTFATRLFAGIGLPYGNSDVVPYTKQYFSGGPYSVRAFRTRSLGPGSYEPDDNNSYYDQTGNLRLEANAEYRFPIVNVLKGALFVDAGNVWNTTDNEALEGDTFGGDFMSELGIGGGFGLRVDIQSFVIRLDLAAPFHDPSLPEGERWSWDVSNPILNFAIGYPF